MKLEEKLVSLRKAKGLSQMKLAEMMNVSRQAISRWEVGAAVPSTDNLKFLGRLYDVPLEYLLHDDAPEPVHQETEKNRAMSKKRVFVVVLIVLLLCVGTMLLGTGKRIELDIHGVVFKNMDQNVDRSTTFHATGKENGKRFEGDILIEDGIEKIKLNDVIIDSIDGNEYRVIRSRSNPAVDDSAKVYGILLGNMEDRSFAIILYQDSHDGWNSDNVEVYCFPAKNREEAVSIIKRISSEILWLKDVCWE